MDVQLHRSEHCSLKGNRMRILKSSRSLTLALTALLVLSIAPQAWSDEMAPDAAPPATSDISNEGVPPAPAADPGMGGMGMGAGSPEEAPSQAEEKPAVKKKAKKAKKAAKHKAKKKKKAAKKKKKKNHNNY